MRDRPAVTDAMPSLIYFDSLSWSSNLLGQVQARFDNSDERSSLKDQSQSVVKDAGSGQAVSGSISAQQQVIIATIISFDSSSIKSPMMRRIQAISERSNGRPRPHRLAFILH
jgi:hypothetical protein